MKHRAYRPDMAGLEPRDLPSGGWWSSLEAALGFGHTTKSNHAHHAGHHNLAAHTRPLAPGDGLAAHPHAAEHRAGPAHQVGHGK